MLPDMRFDINGWTEPCNGLPVEFRSVALAYEIPGQTGVYYGFGHRDQSSRCYWLGPRGVDPHYTRIEIGQVLAWCEMEFPVVWEPGRYEEGLAQTPRQAFLRSDFDGQRQTMPADVATVGR